MIGDPLDLAKMELAEATVGANRVSAEIVIGKAVCIDCGAEFDQVRAVARTAWVMCDICGTATAMFIYRGKKNAKAIPQPRRR